MAVTLKHLIASVSLFGTLLVPSAVGDTNKTIYVIRHGEKTYDYNKPIMQKFGCLSQMGWARAYNLVSLFGLPGGKFNVPQAIFSAQYDGPNTHPKGLNCQDEHGWFRTQQTVSAVAAHLGLEVNNQTSFLPRVCLFKQPGPGMCIPYTTNPPEDPHGDCCNPWSATQMVNTLLKNDVDTILVGWEHVNIQFLSTALADFPEGNTAVDIVRGQTAGTWPHDNYDFVYEFHYTCSTNECEFLSLTINSQDFKYLGPTYGCGFSVPDMEDIDADYVKNDWNCIFSSSCPVCPKGGSGSKGAKLSNRL